MKAIGLATAMTLVLLLLATLTFRLVQSEQRARQLAALYAVCAALLACLWLATPDDLGVLPRSLVVMPRWLDLLLTLFFFSAAFFGGVLQLYNLADRGFSLRTLMDAREHPSGPADADRLIGEYGGGRGIRWMYDKRVADMLQGKFIARAADNLVLCRKGISLADVFMRIRQFLRLELRSPRAHLLSLRSWPPTDGSPSTSLPTYWAGAQAAARRPGFSSPMRPRLSGC